MAIRKRILKDGRAAYDVVVYIAPGKRRCKTVHSKAAAVTLEATLIAERDAVSARDGSLTLKHYIYNMYWPVAVKRLSATSCDTYEQEIRLRIIPSLGHMPLRDIDRAAIQALMVDRCKTSGVARFAISVLKTILNEAVHDGFITRNYACSKFALPSTPPRSRDNGLILSTFAEIREALDYVDEHAPLSVQRIAYTGLLQGLRPEERYALDWSCFDISAKTVTIKEARIKASPMHGGIQDKKPKTKNSARTIPMHPGFYAYITSTPSGNGAFIQGAQGGRISPNTARTRWKIFLRDNPSFPPVTIENMRHSFATAYLDAGGRIETLSKILGHANVSTTLNRYYRPDIDTLRRDLSRIAQESRMNDVSPGQRQSSILRASTTQIEALLQVIGDIFENDE